MNELDIRSL